MYPWEPGGVQKRVWEISRRLSDDHDVHWYGLHYWDGPSVIEREGVTLHGVMDPVELYVDGRRSITEALRFAAHLAPALAGERFDVVDVQEFPYFPAFTGKLRSVTAGAPLVLTWHEVWGDYWYEYLDWKGAAGKAIEWLTGRLPDLNVSVSEGTARGLEELGVSSDYVIPNGIDLAEIDAAPVAPETPDALYVGRLIPEKNLDVLIRAVEALHDTGRDVTAHLVGDGPERDALERQVAASGVEDHVTIEDPRADYEAVLGLLKSAGAFATPSRREGFGITALEALAAGTPVVTVDHPDNAVTDFVEDGETGFVTALEADAFATGLERALARDSWDACRDRASEYDWDRIADRTEAVYEEVVA